MRRNRAAAPPKAEDKAPAPGPTIVNNDVRNTVTNNVTLTPPAERPYVLVALFLGFAVACVALVYRPKAVRYFYKPPAAAPPPAAGGAPAARVDAPSGSFRAAARQPQREAVAEIAQTGLPAYFRAHRGEGTCRTVAGSAEVLQAGVLELLRPYAAGGWEVTWEDDHGFAISAKANLAMGFAFYLYASAEKWSTDCEILYAISAPVEDAYRAQMEESLHQGLPWIAEAAAGKLAAARSKEKS